MIWKYGCDCFWIQYNSPRITLLKKNLKQLNVNINAFQNTKKVIVRSSAVKWIITITHIQNKSFCLHNICIFTVFIYYVYINIQAYSIYFENIYSQLCI